MSLFNSVVLLPALYIVLFSFFVVLNEVFSLFFDDGAFLPVEGKLNLQSSWFFGDVNVVFNFILR